ncbi:MAG: hypothetical protein V2A66_10940 [Pseudomonadota bacterium]
MTKTDFNPKVSAIPDNGHPLPSASGNLPKNDVKPADRYSTSGVDQYKGLVSGRPSGKASCAKAMRAGEDPIQTLIGDMMMGDDNPSKPSSADFQLPQVPDLQTDIFKNGSDIDMTGIVTKYAGLEMTIEKLIQEVDKALDRSNMTRMTADEISALWKHREGLEQTLFNARTQLNKARFYAAWQQKATDEAAAALDKQLP